MRKVDLKWVGFDHILGERGRGSGMPMSGGRVGVMLSKTDWVGEVDWNWRILLPSGSSKASSTESSSALCCRIPSMCCARCTSWSWRGFRSSIKSCRPSILSQWSHSLHSSRTASIRLAVSLRSSLKDWSCEAVS